MGILDFLRRIAGHGHSSDYRIIHDAAAADGWRDRDIAARQHKAWSQLVRDMHAGRPRSDLMAAAEALKVTGMTNAKVIEIGCGSGYYGEILPTLAGPLRYTGLDYSLAMIALARQTYPRTPFFAGDATRLPLSDACCDVAFSGNSLMHIPDTAAAVAEAARIARRWCIFHSVPVMEKRATARLQKKAYGVDVLEIVFNRGELENQFALNGLAIRDIRESAPYDLFEVVGESTRLLTYLCEKTT